MIRILSSLFQSGSEFILITFTNHPKITLLPVFPTKIRANFTFTFLMSAPDTEDDNQTQTWFSVCLNLNNVSAIRRKNLLGFISSQSPSSTSAYLHPAADFKLSKRPITHPVNGPKDSAYSI